MEVNDTKIYYQEDNGNLINEELNKGKYLLTGYIINDVLSYLIINDEIKKSFECDTVINYSIEFDKNKILNVKLENVNSEKEEHREFNLRLFRLE